MMFYIVIAVLVLLLPIVVVTLCLISIQEKMCEISQNIADLNEVIKDYLTKHKK